jgi:hypothetical protein
VLAQVIAGSLELVQEIPNTILVDLEINAITAVVQVLSFVIERHPRRRHAGQITHVPLDEVPALVARVFLHFQPSLVVDLDVESGVAIIIPA